MHEECMRRVTRYAEAAVFILLYDFILACFDIRPVKKDSHSERPLTVYRRAGA